MTLINHLITHYNAVNYDINIYTHEGGLRFECNDLTSLLENYDKALVESHKVDDAEIHCVTVEGLLTCLSYFHNTDALNIACKILSAGLKTDHRNLFSSSITEFSRRIEELSAQINRPLIKEIKEIKISPSTGSNVTLACSSDYNNRMCFRTVAKTLFGTSAQKLHKVSLNDDLITADINHRQKHYLPTDKAIKLSIIDPEVIVLKNKTAIFMTYNSKITPNGVDYYSKNYKKEDFK